MPAAAVGTAGHQFVFGPKFRFFAENMRKMLFFALWLQLIPYHAAATDPNHHYGTILDHRGLLPESHRQRMKISLKK